MTAPLDVRLSCLIPFKEENLIHEQADYVFLEAENNCENMCAAIAKLQGGALLSCILLILLYTPP